MLLTEPPFASVDTRSTPPLTVVEPPYVLLVLVRASVPVPATVSP